MPVRQQNSREGAKGAKKPPKYIYFSFALLRVLRSFAVTLFTDGYPLN